MKIYYNCMSQKLNISVFLWVFKNVSDNSLIYCQSFALILCIIGILNDKSKN